ncbi:O-Antigen ligase [Rubripirellula lacrimiformis]|uniref:O-Antigen ligase n=1 Tax=Rubripirellula lacrimiformis TaxID=1930273 RepID=A0A517NFG8_9BACT|nr:O-antigen ligase family protein [Rubripirellula lacrimiformis]QDT05880.1 O-Antigen ligase [Rubripirellula lacrimiformis]
MLDCRIRFAALLDPAYIFVVWPRFSLWVGWEVLLAELAWFAIAWVLYSVRMNSESQNPSEELPQGRFDAACLLVVRGCVLAGIVYATWHFGAVGALAQWHLSILIGVGLLAALATPAIWSRRMGPMPIAVNVLLIAWIAYALLQASPSAGPLQFWFQRSNQAAVELAQPLGDLSQAVQRLPDAAASADSLDGLVESSLESGCGTAIQEDTLQATVPYILALGISVLASLGFRTPAARRAFMFTLIGNAVALSAWGIVQRAGGGGMILPGIANEVGGMPFGSFYYKNAGAAALLPGLACLLALRWQHVQRTDPRRPDGYSGPPRTLMHFATLFVAAIVFAGLAASLSRGAWLATVVAVGVIAACRGWRLRTTRAWGIAGGLVVLMIAVALATGTAAEIRDRVYQISPGNLSHDQRWDQWRDGLRMAIANFPSGSGLGTYGYASLPFQSEPRGYWFREAHNQYLEAFAELGLIGLVIVIAGVAWFGKVAFGMLRWSPIESDETQVDASEVVAWGMIGVAILCAGALQSGFDFVLEIPANMLTYASLVAVVWTVGIQRTRRPRAWYPRIVRRPGLRAAVSIMSLGLTLFAFGLSERAWKSQICLQLALSGDWVSSESAAAVSKDEYRQTLQRFDAAIDAAPASAMLYGRRADWELDSYRREVVVAASRDGVDADYSSTTVSAISILLLSQPADGRDQLRESLVGTEELRSPLADGVDDLAKSLRLNPYLPKSHLKLAMLAPLLGKSPRPWLENAARLSNNSTDLLFNVGLMAFYVGDDERMLDQWSRSIAINHDHLQTALDLAATRVSIQVVTERLVPENRPDRIFDLVKRDGEFDLQDSGLPSQRSQLEIRKIIRFLDTTDRFSAEGRLAVSARLYEHLGELDESSLLWKRLVLQNLGKPAYRIGYIELLLKMDRCSEAVDQAVLGQRLFSDDPRFDRLAEAARARL